MGLIIEIGRLIGATAADYILVGMITVLFLFFVKTYKVLITKIDSNAITVKEHLDEFNSTHEKNWTGLTNLIAELRRDKVWQNVYDQTIDNLKELGKIQDERIKVLEECFRNLGIDRRGAKT